MVEVVLDLATSPSGDPLPFFEVQVALDGTTYTLEFRWVEVADAFFLNVYDEAAQTLFQAGVKLVANYPLAVQLTGRSPPGVMFIDDTSGAGADPVIGDLGVRHRLFYATAAELVPLKL